MTRSIYTIGHSTHLIGRFLDHLKRHEISAVADVRAQPYGPVLVTLRIAPTTFCRLGTRPHVDGRHVAGIELGMATGLGV